MPTIPPEGTYTEAELRFIESQPPGLWPENQDSNFGQLRKVLTDLLQERRDEIDMLAAERFAFTSERYLSLWEEMLGAAIDPTGKSIEQRQAVITSCLKYGAFTRPLLRSVIESFLGTTAAGTPAVFGPTGIPILGGIPLYGSPGAVSDMYRVYEDFANYSYAVWIDSANVPDIGALTRELQRITPAGISFTIDTTHTGNALLDYQRTVLSDGPSAYWPLGTTSGTGNPWNSIAGIPLTLSVEGSPTNTGALIQHGGGVVGDTQSRFYDAVDDANYSPYNSALGFGYGGYSLEAWIRLDSFPVTGNYRMAVSSLGETIGGSGFMGVGNIVGTTKWAFRASAASSPALSAEAPIDTPLPELSTTYHIVGTWTGRRSRFYVNGVKIHDYDWGNKNWNWFYANPIYIGRYSHYPSHYWHGLIDEPAVYGYPLSDEQVLWHYQTGVDIL